MKKPSIQSKPLWDIVMSMSAYPAMVVAFDLNIFESLNKKPSSIEELSSLLNIEVRPLETILGVNTSLGLIEYSDGIFKLSELAEIYLLKDSPYNMAGIMDMLSQNDFTTSIKGLKEAVKTNSAPTYAEGDVFEEHNKDIEAARSFTRAMHSISITPALYWPEVIDLSGYRVFLDIAGGSGAHSIGVLNHWPNLKGIVLDIEPVCDVCDEFITQSDLSKKMNTHPGNMWTDEFPQADIHFYSQIFHDWPRTKCSFLANKSFNALPKHGKIILHEMLLNKEKTGPFLPMAASTGMLRWTEGKQYSFNELSEILEDAGFKNIKVIETGFDDWSIVSAEKM